MRHMMVELAAFGAAAATMLNAGCAVGQDIETTSPPFDVMAPISTEDRTAVHDAFDLTKRYLISRHVGAEATKLVILEGDQQIVCPRREERGEDDIVHANNPIDIRYCRATMSVLVSQAGINEMNYFMDLAMRERRERARQTPNPDDAPDGRLDPISRDEMRKHWWNIVQAHEFGHNRQQLLGVTPPKDNKEDMGPGQKYEQQADCFAGATIVKTDGPAFLVRTDFFSHISPANEDDSHGSRWTREGAFIEGALQGAAFCEGMVRR